MEVATQKGESHELLFLRPSWNASTKGKDLFFFVSPPIAVTSPTISSDFYEGHEPWEK